MRNLLNSKVRNPNGDRAFCFAKFMVKFFRGVEGPPHGEGSALNIRNWGVRYPLAPLQKPSQKRGGFWFAVLKNKKALKFAWVKILLNDKLYIHIVLSWIIAMRAAVFNRKLFDIVFCQSLEILYCYLANYLGFFLIKFKVYFFGDCKLRLVCNRSLL